ncbi:MAG TPA: AMP-dependent synthetase/ligase [Candidatus Nanopelagicaceae bacterium]|nr:AMP-dependent synthetase/ligase [Candidatus Nanopelagicaceae bacterium]
MLEFATPAIMPAPNAHNLSDLIYDHAQATPDRVLVKIKDIAVTEGQNQWIPITARELNEQVRACAKGLVAAGVNIGDRVAIMSRTRYEWTVLDFAIWTAGAVVVPIYETSSAEQVEWILTDSEAVALFAETATHQSIVESVRTKAPTLNRVWGIEDGALDQLAAAGINVSDQEIETRRAGVPVDALATLIYTSGTTGRPKGCEVTHANFLVEAHAVSNAAADLFYSEGGSTLLFLPLAHVFGRMIGVGTIFAGLCLGHCPDLAILPSDLASFQPRFILSVPRVFEKIFNTAGSKAEADGKGRIFNASVSCAVRFSQALDSGGPGFLLRLEHSLFDHLVYGKLRAALGGSVKHAISGGAPLGARLGHFFRGIGITVLEGYGLTETTAGATLNLTGKVKIGSVGQPIPGTTIRIATDGEVLIKGPIVFRGYWKNEAATKDAFTEDGFFKSGDLGRLDEDGFLFIVGRKKELIVTSGGKNVAPAVLEDRLRAHPLVSQCVVVGDNKPYIAALITLDQDFLTAWCASNGKSGLPISQLIEDSQLRDALQLAVDEANKAVSKAEAIKRFAILPIDLTIASGHLTPKLSIIRGAVMRDFASEIESVYS